MEPKQRTANNRVHVAFDGSKIDPRATSSRKCAISGKQQNCMVCYLHTDLRNSGKANSVHTSTVTLARKRNLAATTVRHLHLYKQFTRYLQIVTIPTNAQFHNYLFHS